MQMFSREWFDALISKVQTDEVFQKKAVGFDSHLHFKVLKDHKGKLDNDVEFGLWVPDGKPSWYGNKSASEVDIFLEGKAGTYVEVFKGKKNVVMALTMGAVKLKKGSLTKLTGNLGAVNRFIEIVGTIA